MTGQIGNLQRAQLQTDRHSDSTVRWEAEDRLRVSRQESACHAGVITVNETSKLYFENEILPQS